MRTILTEEGAIELQSGDGLWMSAADAERVTGWTLKPAGMCRDDRCVPLPEHAVRRGQVDVEAFWKKLGGPVVHDDVKTTWVLGASAEVRNAALSGTTAPDFTMPDLDGNLRSLSSLRGKKVFLATWASW